MNSCVTYVIEHLHILTIFWNILWRTMLGLTILACVFITGLLLKAMIIKFLSYFKQRWHEHFSNMLFEVSFMEQYIFFLISFHHGFDIDIVIVDRGEWHILQIVLYMIKLLLFIIIFQRYSNIVNITWLKYVETKLKIKFEFKKMFLFIIW